MPYLDAVLLSRLQFAFTIGFHIVFPAFSIGMSAFIATLELLWMATGGQHLHTLARFWTKIFAVSFAMGVVSGIVMEYQVGTNWSRFAQVLGNVLAPLFSYEVLTAFFLEASFLGLMLFGWNRVSPWLHTLASIFVALGTALSGFWILAANSWMQTPDGYLLKDGIAYPVSWLHVIFNPSFPYRFLHMMIATYLTTSLVVAAAGARYLLAGWHEQEARVMLKMGLGMLAVFAPIQALVGDEHGRNTLEHQPAKVAAIEAHWEDTGPAELVLFAWPDRDRERNVAQVAIPHLGSLILTHSWNGRYRGLRDFPRDQRPPVVPVFFAFRAMVGLGLAMIALGWWGMWLHWRRRIAAAKTYLRILRVCWPLGFLALLSGWVVTEVGRQPWIATGLLRTADSMSPLQPGQVFVSLALFVVVYGVVFSIGIWYISRMIRRGPDAQRLGPETLPNRPLAGGRFGTQPP
ncbi:cytochrome ubiquinol oxidase subunit I [Ramlibacter sp.]|uniref:cytochrome ubiquinol oxidase subunit I n=1 Tax=Ramlibacter sp. TaxID=1917967 RepID=UPI00262D0AD7|nr:cytochrome ubiquinol oxidase subunit I [Ramlibacter sp.]MDB5956391.1 cytochrome ubiquinol oxidase subunit [Ramlibacter sp.]